MTRLSDERLTQMRAREQSATKGPWAWFNPETDEPSAPDDFYCDLRTTWERPCEILGGVTSLPEFVISYAETDSVNQADVTFIAHARTDMPELLAAVERVRAMRCPLHNQRDCSPMLNGCSVVIAIRRTLAGDGDE